MIVIEVNIDVNFQSNSHVQYNSYMKDEGIVSVQRRVERSGRKSTAGIEQYSDLFSQEIFSSKHKILSPSLQQSSANQEKKRHRF